MIQRKPNSALVLLSIALVLLPAYMVHSQENPKATVGRITYSMADTSQIKAAIQQAKHLQETNRDSAEVILEATLQSSCRIEFPHGVKKSLSALAAMHLQVEQYGAAISVYLETLHACEGKKGLQTTVPALHNNLANVYVKLGDFEQALVHYEKAIRLWESLALHNAGEIYNNLGGLLIQLGRFEQALYYLNKAELAAKNDNNHSGLVSVYGNKGSYYFESGQWDSSVIYSQKALGVARTHKLPQLEFNALTNLGESYRRHGQPREALTYLSQASTLAPQALPYYRQFLQTVIGNTYLDLKDFGLALRYFEEALESSKETGLLKNLMIAEKGLSQSYEGLGDYRNSLAHYKNYQTLKDSIKQQEIKKSISEWDIKYRTVEKDKKIAESQLQINSQRDALRSKNIWMAGTTAGLLLITALLVIVYAFYRISKHKSFLQEKQLNLLQQQQEIEQLKATMVGEEKERERIARELHDGVGGMLAAIKMSLSSIHDSRPRGLDTEQLSKVISMVESTTGEVRKTAHNLLPDILTRHSLEEALMVYCEHINLSKEITLHFQFHAEIENLDKSTELFLYRITQELLQNIVKHANASEAWVMIKQLGDKLSIIVEDNGSGFEPELVTNSYGLLNLTYRVKSLHGNIDIQSVIERGTTVHIEFDMHQLKLKPSLVR